MVTVESFPVAVFLCVITMLCWGSWANTQKLASKEWRFQLFYWDYAIGVLLMAVLFAVTMGSMGTGGRGFSDDLAQASMAAIGWALLGGIVFNLSNILLVAAIDIAGMAVAFPIGCGLSLIVATITNFSRSYLKGDPTGDPIFVFAGLAAIVIAVVLDALAYGKLPSQGQKQTAKGIVISIFAGLFMGVFFLFVMMAKESNFANPTPGLLTPYTATFVFAVGLFLSNFVWNSLVMAKPFVGGPVPFTDYFTKGNPRLHMVGILGGLIWCVGMTLNVIASGPATPAVAFALGYGAIMVAALWGVFIWKEFKGAPAGTNGLLAMMFILYILGLGLMTYSVYKVSAAG